MTLNQYTVILDFFIMQPCSLRLCTHEVVSERFHNNQIENDVNYKNSRRMKFLVFSLFAFNYVKKSEA